MSPLRRKTSLKDIATELGVSTTLVSYVLNDKFPDRINPQTAQKIRDMAKELNYRTNQVARSLKKDKTFTIGLIIADISNFFYSSITRIIEDEFRKHKYQVLIGSADENIDRFEALVDVFIGRQVDGIILAAPSASEFNLEQLRVQKIPFVLIDRFFPVLKDISSVTLDNYNASANVVKHLVSRGYKAPAMITLSSDLFHLHERTRGFVETVRDLLSEQTPQVIELAEERLGEDIRDIVEQLLKNRSADVLYLATNKIAIEVLSVLAALKVRVPDEVGVVCFDEVDAYRIFGTGITYVRQPLHEIGAGAVDILMQQINGVGHGQSLVLPSTIVIGESTAPKQVGEPSNSEGVATPTGDQIILHFGVGAFHRSHQAYYLQLLQEKNDSNADWRILGACIRSGDRDFVMAMRRQRCRYSLRTVDGISQDQIKVISSIKDILYGPEDVDSILNAIADPGTKVVSFTITEGGYYLNTLTGEFDIANPEVRHDIDQRDEVPQTVFGYLAKGLEERKAQGGGHLVLLSCDNMPENGRVLYEALRSFLKAYNPSLISWVDANVIFPSSMVDRITPRATEEDAKIAQAHLGWRDEVPVVAEGFIQWILECPEGFRFPPLDQVGVTCVSNVGKYEKMKLRILNGGHSLIGLVGDHLGHQYIHESVKDLRIAELYNRYMIGEVIPTLDPIVDTDYIAYSEVVRQRFSNALIRDTNARIISDSSGKFPKFILPVISFNLRNGGDIALGSLIVVAWWIYLRKMVELDKAAAIQDPLRDVLAEAVDKDAPIRQFLQIGAIFGDLADQEAFVGQCETYVARLQEGTFEDLILENINT